MQNNTVTIRVGYLLTLNMGSVSHAVLTDAQKRARMKKALFGLNYGKFHKPQ